MAFLGTIVWTAVGGWSHVPWIGVALGGGLLLGRYSNYRLRRSVQSFIDSAFTARGVEAPTLKLAGGYGYPGCELLFASREAEQAALISGALSAFKASIQDYHRDDGSKSRPFDVGMAVRTTYPNKPPF